MHAVVHVKRRWRERVWRGGDLTKPQIRAIKNVGMVYFRTGYGWEDVEVGVSEIELRKIVDVARSAGFNLDEPERERQRELAWELAHSLGAPQSKLAEAAD